MIVYIAERRRAAGMTQEDLSARLGVDRSAVALWETGARTPGTERLPALAEALGCGIGDLFRPPEAREAAG
ncbi:MAG: helix-turn-helix transcriptional regulator [Clostridia bacterium]|nr:helix-turn-helix transcriptional regulator [Clostridia bacterium]